MIHRLQAVLQWLFLRIEALFNSAFGVAHNPLYHLGAISFFLFWIIAATGLYLYAFFETGVGDAYASVQSITHTQWFAGGILRSVHRYASDAFVLTMLLHMLRYFAFDRFRGFRWFSWVTGVVLVWLVYVSGINGYMLPWDRLAQYVIVTSFEWLDWLPSFGGTLMRNFIYPSSVNDRFFSLLAFMHIGIPLLVLLLMWVHVQRVPKAATTPPRPMTIGILATLLVLAVAAPVLSQGGPADLGSAVSRVHLDWFYLPVFPLLNIWPLGWVWGLLVGVSAFITVLPWIPLKLGRKAKAGEYRMRIAGAAAPVVVRAGETLLDAGLRAGVALPYECRNGGCGVCLCSVVQGSVDHGLYQRAALPDALRQQGKTLMCCATPLSDLEVEVDAPLDGPAVHVQTYEGRVDSLEHLSPDVIRMKLSLPPDQNLSFEAGQYINFVLDDGQRRAFSFANAPQVQGPIELHVRLIPGGRFTTHVFEQLKVGDTLRFEGPHGHFVLQPGSAPIIFVAGATGFAPIKSIVEDAFARGVSRPMWLYWGVRKPADLYLRELAESWQREHPDFHFVPVLSEATEQDAWDGRRGLVHEAILQDFPNMAGHEVYVCGSARMVESAIPAFVAQGLSDDACFSDAFIPSR
jgi:NAD(P)H-flavin reductase/quinol-cytochrome oxidoreductase complex cytochrome b subunit